MSSAGNPRRNARKRIPPATRRRALELLASCPDGCTEAIMLAHGFSIERMVELVRAGLATTQPEHMVAGGRQTQVTRVRITEAGRDDGRGHRFGRLRPQIGRGRHCPGQDEPETKTGGWKGKISARLVAPLEQPGEVGWTRQSRK
jgi:hypothetical protein